MRRTLLQFATVLLLLLTVQVSLAQQNNDTAIIQLQQDIKDLKTSNSILKTELKNQKSDFSKLLKAIKDSIDTLQAKLNATEELIHQSKTDLGKEISTTKTEANEQNKNLDNKIKDNTLYWIIAVLAIALLSVLLFGLLRKQLSKEKTDTAASIQQTRNSLTENIQQTRNSLTENIQQTKKALEEEGIKLDSKLIDLLATQMQLMKEERQAVPSSKAEEVNHELHLKIANAASKIQMNLSVMDSSIRGHTNLQQGAKSIIDNLEVNGYEIIEWLGKPFNSDYNMEATKEPDSTLKKGEEIIKRIIRPQVNYNKKMIQPASVVVGFGE